MPRVGFEPTRKRFLRPPPLPLGYRGSLFCSCATARQCSEQDSNLQHRASRTRASTGLGYQSVCVSPQWTPVGVEPTFPGCRPGVLPLDDGPVFSCSVAGRVRTFSLGLRMAAL